MNLGSIVFLLAATVALVPLASRLGLGAAMAYLAAGVLAGPHALGLLADPASLGHAAEFGVVMMLFLIGLELRPRELWRLRGPLVALGGAQVAGTAALTGLVALAFGLPWQASVAVGAAMAMSSTALALPALKDRGLGAGPAGHGALAILLFQDIAVIPLLALLPLLGTQVVQAASHGHSVLDFLPPLARTPAAIAGLAVVLVATQWSAKHVFRWLARSRQAEAMTAMGLLLVSGIAMVAGGLGLSAALGAFLGGVLLADSEYRHEIEADLEPFRGLFLGFFFATVGAGLNIPLIAENPVRVVSLAIGLFVLKGAVLWGLASLARMPLGDRLPLALGLAQVGEFAFVLLGLSKGVGILEPDLAELLGGAVAVSMPLTPLALALWWTLRSRNLSSGSTPTDMEAPEDLPSSEAPVLLVVAVDDQEDGLDIVRAARARRPDIPVLLRVRDHRGAYQALAQDGIVPFRETFATALDIARASLSSLGWRETRAHRAVELFRRHNETTLRELSRMDEGSADWLRLLRVRIDEASSLERTEADPRHVVDRAWDNESLRAEVRRP